MGNIDAKVPKPGMEIKGKFGIYKLVEDVGRGGNSTVFSVEVISAEEQLPTKENFVMKILKSRFRSKREWEKREKRFEREVRTICKIQKEIDRIIPIYDTSYFLKERGEFVWYLMPRALPYNFREIQSTEEKLKDMRDIGECIVQLHNRRLAHRDIKPQNLLVYGNRVCLADFGLVRDMDETEVYMTDIHDVMGPVVIRPPEMRNIVKPNDIDYQKSDVYLFAKTVWIILTGEEGFSEEYRRSEKRVYLDKKKLRLETAEPLHVMLEAATQFYWKDRIDIRTCIKHIDDQLNIIAKRASNVDLGKWKFDETVKEIRETISPDIRTYQNPYFVLEVLERMAKRVNLTFEEAGKIYDPMFFKGVKILPENLFELDIKSIYYNNSRKIVVEIEKLSIKEGLSCIMDTKIIVNHPNNVPVFTNLNKALQSMDKRICISGVYGIRLVQTGSYS